MSKLILVWPKGPKISPKTIHIPGYQPGKKVMELAENLTIYSNQMLGAYVPAYKSIPLRLGFCFKPIWSSTRIKIRC